MNDKSKKKNILRKNIEKKNSSVEYHSETWEGFKKLL